MKRLASLTAAEAPAITDTDVDYNYLFYAIDSDDEYWLLSRIRMRIGPELFKESPFVFGFDKKNIWTGPGTDLNCTVTYY